MSKRRTKALATIGRYPGIVNWPCKTCGVNVPLRAYDAALLGPQQPVYCQAHRKVTSK